MMAADTTAEVSPARAKPSRRWRQFSLRTLLLAMVAFSIVFALFALRLQRARKQAAAVATIRKLGGTVGYDYQYSQYRQNLERFGVRNLSKGDSAVPPYLLKWLGLDFFHDVVLIHCGDDNGSHQEVSQWWNAVAVLTKAKEINASGNWVSGRMTTETVQRHRALRHLALTSGRLSGKDLAPLARLTELETLALRENQIDDEGMRHVALLPKLKELLAPDNQIGDKAMVELSRNSSIEVLQVGHNPITDKGAVHLGKMRQLTNLELDATLIGDGCLPAIGKLTNLELLFLGETGLSDGGIVHLKGLANLRGLFLGQTKITDGGLAELKSLSALEKLHLSGTQVSAEAVKQFQDARPGVVVSGVRKASRAFSHSQAP